MVDESIGQWSMMMLSLLCIARLNNGEATDVVAAGQDGGRRINGGLVWAALQVGVRRREGSERVRQWR